MLTLNNLINELKDVPASRWEELHEFMNLLTPKSTPNELTNKKILSFGGAFSDMSDEDYTEYVDETKKLRKNLFDRNIDI